MALRETPLSLGDLLTLVNEVGGHPEPSTVTALAGPGNDTRLYTLSEGLGEGAAILDGAGRLAGIARSGGLAAVKPMFLAAFLRSNGVVSGGKAAGDPDKAMVAMICDPSRR
jgi:hypothetical protein